MTTSLRSRYAAALMNTFGVPKLVLVKGEGAYVWDEDGNRYLDLLGGIAVNALGHAHPALVAAVITQLRTLGHVSNYFATEPQVRLAERLLELLNHGDGRVFFTNSGTEANEAAFKASRLTGRTHIVAAEGCFHGRTMGALAVTSKEAYRAPFEPLPGEVTFVPYGDVDALAAVVTDRTAAVVLEPLQGEAGVVGPREGYLAAARAITTGHGALLWLDEVQTGMGRVGEWFAHDGIRPDLITLAKGLGAGIPIGACIGFGAAAGLLQPGNHGTTFGGNPVAAAAALAVIDTIEAEGLLDNARKRGEQIREALTDVAGIERIDGKGLLLGIVLDGDYSAELAAAAQAAGFIVNPATPNRIRLAPPLILTEEQADEFAAAVPDLVAQAKLAKAELSETGQA
ncbi:MAG: acetylornithine transaminase [Nocardioidaceae bacterium]|nr:MAG: acetylornithine transaminase [Nocardioidaceae bacterium]